MERVGHVDNLYGRPLLLKACNILDMTTVATKTDMAFSRAPITCVQISGQVCWSDFYLYRPSGIRMQDYAALRCWSGLALVGTDEGCAAQLAPLRNSAAESA